MAQNPPILSKFPISQKELSSCIETISKTFTKIFQNKDKIQIDLPENEINRCISKISSFSKHLPKFQNEIEALLKKLNKYESTNIYQCFDKPLVENIQGIEHILSLSDLPCNYSWSPLELHDSRIAISGADGSITICSIDLAKKEFIQDIKKKDAHSSYVMSLCELNENRLISASEDKTITIWEVFTNTLSPLKTINAHDSCIRKVESLSHERFASCSTDKTIKVWKSVEGYENITTITCEGEVWTILALRDKDVLVSSAWFPNSIEFWNMKDYQKLHSIDGYYASWANHFIELQNGNIAISSNTLGFPIAIINTSNYTVVKEIKSEEFMKANSSLCPWGMNTFIFIHEGWFVQLNNENCSVIYKTNMEKQLNGQFAVISIRNGKYLLVDSKENGFVILEPY